MPKIDFYILPANDRDSRFMLVCRLIEKAYRNQHRIYIHTDDEQTAHHLDELLWTYREECFLPHNLYGEGPNPPPPIQIGFTTLPEKQRDILINLCVTVPDFYSQFSRIFEIIIQDPNVQNAGRDRYRFYRSQGLEIKSHQLQTVES